MFHLLEKRIGEAFASRIEALYGVKGATQTEHPKQSSFGEIAVPAAFQLARQLRKAPKAIAGELAEAAGAIDGVAALEIAGNGYINVRLDRGSYAAGLLGGGEAPRAAAGEKIIVEHTNINPNKAAHIGHLRNAVLGDTFVRMQRAAGRKAYDELIATAGFPKKPDGSPMVYRTAVKVGVIFEASKNKAKAKEFLKFMLEEENLRPYVEGALGRWFPVTLAGQASPFWQADKHRKAVYDQFKAGTTPFEFTKNYKFIILNNENAWAKAMNRVVNEKVPVDKAVDELIARIKEVAG